MRVTRQEQEAADRMARILRQAVEVIGTSVRAMAWLDSPHPDCAGQTPAELTVASDDGATAVSALLEDIGRSQKT